ncbi:penicillin-binding transpeptidase domain-containing protein [Nonomuraea lactucae]|uniref:penicillin-binding transpeptidase domain-containing protein n=1 Tax=Nonomuraea lactucae TaxID=2249762 RepID=UPI000DE3AAFB|nr:penicillin-binding transpeptidase domain-containing protein [Nonomuraea lactucae]
MAILGSYGFAVLAANRVKGSAAQVSASYFRAWLAGDVQAMARLVHDPPADFVGRHLSFSQKLHVEAIELRPGPVRSTGRATAEVAFTGTRTLRDLGPWPFAATLRLAVRGRAWKVLWTPETLHPLLRNGGTLDLAEVEGPATELLTSEGDKIPNDSYADAYLDRLRPEFEEEKAGLALVSTVPGQLGQRLLTAQREPKTQRTTLSRPVQAAAARSLDGVENAAIVALRPSSGEVLAVADRLLDNRSAFHDLFPPGSTFKTITAAALLESGLDPAAEVSCPGTYQIPFHRTFDNAEQQDRGTLSFTDAFAHSCNTTFVQEAVTRLRRKDLRETAEQWGFGRPMPTGVGGRCGALEDPQDLDWFGADAIGQGTVVATPLCMATIAAAVQSGTWRPPRLLPAEEVRRVEGFSPPEPVTLDEGIVASLRDMMAAVVDHGTASEAGLPAGVSGKTGTAETEGEPDHGWFIGYRDDLAFCVFVRNGGSARSAALPITARFLNAL